MIAFMADETSGKRRLNPLALVLILSSIFFFLFLMISMALFFFKGPSDWDSMISDMGGRGSYSSDGSVGVVEINGVIMDSKKILEYLADFEENKKVKAVVIRLNSPGGSVAPSQEIYEAVKKYPKPVVSSMASVAASGAFYVAMGTKKVFANPGTITGSIGVIMEFVNLEKLYDWAKVNKFNIKTGKYKDSGSEARPMRPDEKELFQGMIDNVLEQFRKAVQDSRKLSREEVIAVSDGRIFSGEQAHAAKLVDQLGTLDDAVQAAAQMAGIQGKAKAVYPRPRRKGSFLFNYLLDDLEDSQGSGGRLSEVQKVTEVTKMIGFGLTGHSVGRRLSEEALVGVTPGIYWLWDGSR